MRPADDPSELDSAQFSIVEAVADRFDAAWREQQAAPSMLPFLVEVPPGAMRRALVEEMVKIDEHCRRQLGLPMLSEEDYCRQAASMPLDVDAERTDAPSPTTRSAQSGTVGSIDRIGKYPTLRSLGDGGQAVVFEAFHPDLGKKVVIKMSHDVVEPNSPERDRLLAEGRILADIEHPGLVRVYDFDIERGHPFLVMEHVNGLNLKDFVAQHHLAPSDGARLLAHVARAIGAMHRRGIVHQDIKPQNILVDEQGQARVIDLGLASVRCAWTEATHGPEGISGTIPYMAPEQARGEFEKINSRCDIFGLGAVLYWMLTGQAPFWSPRPAELSSREYWTLLLELAKRCDYDRSALARPQIPRRLSAICLKAMAPDPAQRYSSAEQLAEELERASRPSRWPGRVAAAGLVIAASAVVAWWYQVPREPIQDLPTTPALTMSIFRGKAWNDPIKKHLMPIQDGDELRLRLDGSPRMNVTFFWLHGRRPTQLLPPGAAKRDGAAIMYPGAPSRLKVKPSPDEASADTEMILVCGKSNGPISTDEIERLWNSVGPWPVLPPESVLRVLNDKILTEATSRDVEIVSGADDAEFEVRSRLEKLRQELAERVDFFEGIAFRHGPD